MPKHIGIVACSAEGAALCYRTICVEGEQLMGRHAHPEVSMHTFSLDDYMQPIYRGDWQAVGELMLASANKLAKIGADFLICPDNTIHQALRYVEPRSPLPWLHIAECVAAQAVERGYRRLALTGTRWLVDSNVYPEKLEARGLSYLLISQRFGVTLDEFVSPRRSQSVAYPRQVAMYLSRELTSVASDDRKSSESATTRPSFTQRTRSRGSSAKIALCTPLSGTDCAHQQAR